MIPICKLKSGSQQNNSARDSQLRGRIRLNPGLLGYSTTYQASHLCKRPDEKSSKRWIGIDLWEGHNIKKRLKDVREQGPSRNLSGFPQGWRAGGEGKEYDSEEIALLFARIMRNFVK